MAIKATYLIRREANGQFTVSKWNMGKCPTDVYVVRLEPKPKCSCPGGHNHKHCKHTGMVRDWVSRGMREFEEITCD